MIEIQTAALADPTTVENYKTLDINMDLGLAYLDACISHGVRYGLGAKCPENALGNLPIEFNAIDCSGLSRSFLMAATKHMVKMPDGSYCQHDDGAQARALSPHHTAHAIALMSTFVLHLLHRNQVPMELDTFGSFGKVKR